ncbi:hypothetical protein RJ55_07662 [Drechmeria coniospora]|nr:hypothetical protein RJ55_07662 [Drechmeria coniospora]
MHTTTCTPLHQLHPTLGQTPGAAPWKRREPVSASGPFVEPPPMTALHARSLVVATNGGANRPPCVEVPVPTEPGGPLFPPALDCPSGGASPRAQVPVPAPG